LLLLLLHEALKGFGVPRLELKHFLEGDVRFFWLVALLVQNAQIVPNFAEVWLQG
jgi:hypothetical protein